MTDIEKLEKFKNITILYGSTFGMHIEQLKEIQEAIGNVLSDLYEANNRINDLLYLDTQKDKLIDEMAIQLSGLTIWDNKKDEPIILSGKEEVIHYFEERCK